MFSQLLSTLLAYFARAVIRKYRPDVIGITGSVGKTSTKEAIAAVLAVRFRVRKNWQNYNNDIGLPLTVLGFSESPGRSFFGWKRVFLRALWLLLRRDPLYPEVLVLEMGADKPGDIAKLIVIAPCHIGVLTAIAHAHTEFFKTIKKIAQEKRLIISQLPLDGTAVVNFDSELVMQQITTTKANVISYGFKEGADMRAIDINLVHDAASGWPNGIHFKVAYQGSLVPVVLPGTIAEHMIPSALAALAVGVARDINLVEGVQALTKLDPLPGRMRVIPGIKRTLIIDDTYNSSPDAVRAALKTLASVPVALGQERIAVLGDMFELGPETEAAHRDIGWKVVENDVNVLITVGQASKHTAAAAREAGMPEHQVISFDTSLEAGKFLQELLKIGDVVLVKGSRGMHLERVVKEVMEEPLRATELLVHE